MVFLSIGCTATITDEPFPDYVISLLDAKNAIDRECLNSKDWGKNNE